MHGGKVVINTLKFIIQHKKMKSVEEDEEVQALFNTTKHMSTSLSSAEASVGYITISIEIHFTTLYMADLGTRAGPLGEGAQAGN